MNFLEKIPFFRRKEKKESELHPPTSESGYYSTDFESRRKAIIENISSMERALTEEELLIIGDANRRTAAIIEKYGLLKRDADPNNVHVIPSEKWPGGEAFFSRELNGIVIPESYDEEKFILTVIHEMFHLKGVNFLPIPLTEAIVECLTNEAINLDDTTLIGVQIHSGIYTYPDNRRAFVSLLEKIINNAPSNVSIDKLQVFAFFAKAHLSGDDRHLSFFDNLFGIGTLEALNKLDDRLSSLMEFTENLGAKKL